MKQDTATITVPNQTKPIRLDIFLSEQTGETRSQIKKLIQDKRVLINTVHPKKAGDIVQGGDIINILEKHPKKMAREEHPEEVLKLIPEILKETDHYLVINKPSGLLTHPTQAGEPWSVSHWVWEQYPTLDGVGEYTDRPGIVHRLDKETSGILIIAKTQEMFTHLKAQFKAREIDKTYTALVHGVIERDIDTIDFDIDRGKDGRMVARPKTNEMRLKNVGKEQPGKYAKTEFEVITRYSRYTLLDVHIFTGRTHQIRVHLFAYNNPVVGDTLYTSNKLNKQLDTSLGRIFLHASRFGFTDLSGEEQHIVCPLPPALQQVLDTLV